MKRIKRGLVATLLCAAVLGTNSAPASVDRTALSIPAALQPPAAPSRTATGRAAMLVLFLAGMMLRRQASFRDFDRGQRGIRGGSRDVYR